MKLEIELVPEPCWYSNMRKVLTQKQWDTLRRSVYAKYGNHCAFCGIGGMMHCHEIWDYDDNAHVQTLKGFVALCPMCHHIKHLGLAGIMAREGRLNYDTVIEHFCKVNECSTEDFEQAKAHAFEQWRERNKHEWRTDLGEYAHMVQKSC